MALLRHTPARRLAVLGLALGCWADGRAEEPNEPAESEEDRMEASSSQLPATDPPLVAPELEVPLPATPSLPGPAVVSPSADVPPLSVHDVRLEPQSGPLGERALAVRAQAVVHHPVDHATYVHAKVACRSGERLLVDTGYLNANYRHPLTEHDRGELANLEGMLFNHGLPRDAGPCEVELALAGSGGQTPIPLTTSCHADRTRTEGPCAPLLAPPAASALRPMTVHDLLVQPLQLRGGLEAEFVLELAQPLEGDAPRITLKAACQRDGVKLVAIDVTTLSPGPFALRAGESLARRATLFYDPAFGLDRAPGPCDLQVALWPREAGGGTGSPVVLGRSCYRDGKTTPGPCPPAEGSIAPGLGTALALDRVRMEVVEPFGSKGQRFELKLQADATVFETMDPHTGVTAHVTCKVGKSARTDTVYPRGVDLRYLEPAETTRLSATAFSGHWMGDRPHSCEAVFVAASRYSATGEDEETLGRWCFRGGHTGPGSC